MFAAGSGGRGLDVRGVGNIIFICETFKRGGEGVKEMMLSVRVYRMHHH